MRYVQIVTAAVSMTVSIIVATAALAHHAPRIASSRHEVIAPAKPVPGESLYQLRMDLTTQDGKKTSLAALRGRPVLITMFYSSCDGVCPMLAFTMRRMEGALTPQQRNRLRVVMVSFDPQRDTPQALAEFAQTNKLDLKRWMLARAPETQVRELAAVLGIRYRELAEGVFNHSTVIAALDTDGVVRAHTSTLSELDPGFMRKLTALIGGSRFNVSWDHSQLLKGLTDEEMAGVADYLSRLN